MSKLVQKYADKLPGLMDYVVEKIPDFQVVMGITYSEYAVN
jgi:hypothetical protein